MHRPWSVSLAPAFALVVATACAGGDTTAPIGRTIDDARLVAVEGDRQTAIVGSVAVTAPRVRVTTARGAPLAGVLVAFAPSGGGSVGAERATTNGEGYASAERWTLGTVPGPQTVRATLGSQWVDFTATAVLGRASVLAPIDPADSAFEVGVPRRAGPGVRVTDAFGNVFGGQSVMFALTLADGARAPLASVDSDSGGIARLPASTLSSLALSSTGRYVIAASIPGATVVLPVVVLAGSGCYNRTLAIGARVTATLTADDCLDSRGMRYDDYAPPSVSAQTDFTVDVEGILELEAYRGTVLLASEVVSSGTGPRSVRYVLPAPGLSAIRPATRNTYGGYTLATRASTNSTPCGEIIVTTLGAVINDSLTMGSCIDPARPSRRIARYRVSTFGGQFTVRVTSASFAPALGSSYPTTDASGASVMVDNIPNSSFTRGETASIIFSGSSVSSRLTYQHIIVTSSDDALGAFTLAVSQP